MADSKKQKKLVAGSALKAFTSDVYDITEIDRRQISQKAADYDPFGAKGGKGCANCQWFVSPNSCILVAGDISPNGISKFYTAEVDVEPDAFPVYIVESKSTEPATQLTPEMLEAAGKATKSNNNLFASIYDFFTGKKKEVGIEPFWLVKYKDKPWRFFMVYSNQFKDAVAETISEAAHKEYVEWVTKTGLYPTAQLWHGGPGTEWGQIDFVDYVDGFAISSGTVNKGKEHVAEALEVDAKEGKIRVSHGYYGLKSADGIYLIYRDFEQSPLPVGAEANKWTGMGFDMLNTKESDMPFSEAKRTWLKEKMGVDDSVIAGIETGFKGAADSLKAAGVEFKEGGTEPVTKADGTVDPLATVIAEFKGIGDSIKSLADGVNTKLDTVVKEQNDKIDTIAAAVGEIGKQVKKSQDELVAEAYKAAGVTGVGAGYAGTAYKASEQATSSATKQEANIGPGGQDWLTDMLDKQLQVGVQQSVQNVANNGNPLASITGGT